MLDAYIIERIRQREERAREEARIPLRIDPPPAYAPRERTEEEPASSERGVVEIDFSI